jgi:hypothetical protein
MDKKAALNSLEKIANILDIEKLHKEADTVTKIMIKIASDIIDVDSVTAESNSKGQAFLNLPGGQKEVPSVLMSQNPLQIKGKTYHLGYDTGSKNFVWYDKGNMRDFYPVDSSGKMLERRQKSPFRLDKALGIKFPNAKLPRVTNLEERLRKDVVKPLSNTLRETIGDPLRDTVTKPITGVLGRAGEQVGISSPGRKSEEEADLAFSQGESENRETQSPVDAKEVVTKPFDVDPKKPEPTKPEPTPTNVDDVIKNRGSELRNIASPNDLLFWCMSVSLGISYGPGLAKDVRSKPEYYYNRKNMSKIVGLIVKLAESATVAKINPKIKEFRRGAIDMLYAKIRDTEKVK